MTTIQAPEQWSFGGVSLSSLAYFVGQVDGADDLPPLRGQDVPFTGIPGRRSVGKLFDGRQITLLIVVMPQDSGGTTTGTNRQQARVNMDAIKQVLGRRVQDNLTRLMPNGTTRTARAECIAISPVTDPAGGEMFTLLVTFFLADPYFYAADVIDTSRTFSASPLAFNFTRLGTVRTHKATIDVLGPVTTLRVTNSTTGTWVECATAVPGGQHLVIDVAAFTALLSGASVIGAISHSGDRPFLTFDPGVNALSITGTGLSGSGRITSTVKDPYL